MIVPTFTDEQANKARHALGLTQSQTAYRNYYLAPDDPDWNDLVERGLAVKRKSPVSPDFIYHLTRRAAVSFLSEGECLHPELTFGAKAR